jgi:hypothetical protein
MREENMASRMGWSPGPASWTDDVAPMSAADWNYDRAAHLLTHVGFGGTPADIQKLTDAGFERAVRSFVHYEDIPNPRMQPFVESGLWDPTLDLFPESRPEATERAAKNGVAIGVKVKPGGNRPIQPVSDRFFYWLRATLLETRRLGYWWANGCCRPPIPCSRRWRCCGTATSRPTRTRSATTGR